MLKPYDKAEDIPAELKDHYSRREDGKYHADIPDSHPAVKHNAKLLTEKTAAEGKVTDLESQLESAKASGLPRGHVAVPKADADLLAKVKEHGTAEEVAAKLTEYPTLKEKEAQRATAEHAGNVADVMGWDKAKAALLVPAVYDLSQVELRDKDGKKTAVAKVKQADGSVVEKPFAEVVTADEKLSSLVPALSGQQQQRRGGNGGDPPPVGVTSADAVEEGKKAARATGKYAF